MERSGCVSVPIHRSAPVPALAARGLGSQLEPAEPSTNHCLSPALAVSTELSQGCARGCDLCSEFNGCLRCSPKLFILLERNDIRQIGICLPSCPLGYFGLRNTDMNKCISEYCESCFSRNFCTKCKEGLYLHKGRCYVTCPEGYAAANGTMECTQCEMSEWGPWGPCSKKRKLCGFKKGNEDRTRRILQAPSGDVSLCPPTTEVRRCTVQKSQCPEGEQRWRERWSMSQ
uniref:R-spondin 1 n=1 Tax=Malurus cyaneus samueli TaxID=2593467 RepID=A0A8C5UD09_9PASS